MRGMVIALALAGMFSTGCAAESPVAPGAVTSVDALASALRAEGAAVVVEGSVSREAYPFFSISGVQLSVGGQRITAFAYPTAEAAAAAAASVSKDGSTVGTSNIFWVAPPRFYRKDAVIVLYVGTDSSVITLLDRALGAPFASR